MEEAAESGALAERTGFVDALQHVLLFADWRARGSAPCVCKTWHNALLQNQNDSHWEFLCERLRDDHRLYLPAGICPSTDGWRAHFDKLWAQRNLWKVDEKAVGAADTVEAWQPTQQLSEQTFSVSVAVRFRPAVATAGGKDAATAEGDAVVMPLHQRVAMVRAKHGCSQAKAMRIVMKQEAAAKKKEGGGGTEMEMEACTVAVGKAISQSELDRLEANRAQAAEAHLAAEDHEDMEYKRRLKPHIFGARAKSREPNFANGYTTSGVAATPADPFEAAIFDQAAVVQADPQGEAAGEAAGEAEPMRGIVMVRSVPARVTAAELVAFFDKPAVAAGVGSDRALSGRVLGGERGVHLISAEISARDATSSSAPLGSTTCEAFVEFSSSDAADQAVAFSDGQRLHSANVEVFRATEEHMAAVLAEKCAGERAAAARRAEEAREAAERRRLESIAAARAARAAEKERHKLDAERLKAAKAKAAEAEAAGISPYGVSDGKENVPGSKGGAEGAAAGDKAESAAAHDTKAAIVNVDTDKSAVLAMAPGCGLRPFNFERVFDADAKQEHVYELCGRAAVADVLNGHSACVLVYGQTGAGKTHTMFGDGTADPRRGSSRYGVVPRVCEELITATDARRALGIDTTLKVAYVEVFGAEVTDLLRDGGSIGAADDGADNHFHAHRWVLEGRADVPIDSVDGALELIAKGDGCKRKAATAMNERSSRAHALFILSLTQTEVRSHIRLSCTALTYRLLTLTYLLTYVPTYLLPYSP